MLAVGSAVRRLCFRLRSTRVKYRTDVPNYVKSTDMPVIALVEFVWTLGRLTRSVMCVGKMTFCSPDVPCVKCEDRLYGPDKCEDAR